MILNSNYWENRYTTNDTGWDTGQITTPIKEYIDQIKDKSIKILIPGCGNGHEFDYLSNNGFTNVFVLDYAKSPLENLSKRNPNFNANHFIQSDFFEHTEQYDLIIEQTFFCALDPLLRADYASKMNTLLYPNGKITGVLFQFPLTEKGPPFGGSKLEYENLFFPYFNIKTLATAYNSIKPRQGNELFFIFEKKLTE